MNIYSYENQIFIQTQAWHTHISDNIQFI